MWSRAKHSSKQCRIQSRAISKGISKGIPQETRKCCQIQRRLFEPRLRALTLGRRLRVLPNTKRRARAVISSAKWLRGTPEQRFRAASGYGARPSSDFERKARPVRCFRVLSAWLVFLALPDSSGEFKRCTNSWHALSHLCYAGGGFSI